MARVDVVKRESLNARQVRLYDAIMKTRPRGNLSGPFSVWIHTPEIAEAADALANCFRFDHKLDQRLIELIVLLMCRDATVKYAWAVHEPLARKAGLALEVIAAIRSRKRPDFKQDDERQIYDLITELTTTKSLTAASFERATAAFGRDGVIEAVSCAGFYGMVGLVINAFDIPPQTDDVLN